MVEILGKKVGMTHIFNEIGVMEPVTVVEAGPCYVVNMRTKEKDGYQAVQLGFIKAKKTNKAMEGYFKKQGMKENFRYLKEFRKEKLDGYSVGQEVKADAFKLNEVVHVTGTSIGKGFQGSVKRWHFNRHPMSHGSKSHRMPGSSGSGTTISHVFKGKRRAGHMGFDTVTTKGLVVLFIDAPKNILAIRGSVPGPKGNLLTIKGTGIVAKMRVRKIAQAPLEKAAKIAAESSSGKK
ncbi:MAG: 50S ribosomal protein L3 [bacterium]